MTVNALNISLANSSPTLLLLNAVYNDNLLPLIYSYQQIQRTSNKTKLCVSEMRKCRGCKKEKATLQKQKATMIDSTYEIICLHPI